MIEPFDLSLDARRGQLALLQTDQPCVEERLVSVHGSLAVNSIVQHQSRFRLPRTWWQTSGDLLPFKFDREMTRRKVRVY